MKKGVEIIPEENYRLRNEDIYSGDQMKFGSKTAGKNGSVGAESDLSTSVQSY